MFYLGASLLIIIGILHSYLGERYILIRLFNRANLPKLFASTEFTKNTLRFAWHLTTAAWFGFAALLLHLANGDVDIRVVTKIIAITFIAHAIIALVGSKGKHFSWPVFLVIGLTLVYESYFLES